MYVSWGVSQKYLTFLPSMIEKEEDEEVLKNIYNLYIFPSSQAKTFQDNVYAEMMGEIISERLCTLSP